MTKLETLNRRMLLLEREVSISCEEYDTYKALLESVEALTLLMTDRVERSPEEWHAARLQAREALEQLK